MKDTIQQATELEKLEQIMRENSERNFLKSTGKFLVGVWELSKIVWNLRDGHSMVINKEGEIFTGRVDTKKLTQRPELLGRKDTAFDFGSVQQHLQSRSWVQSPSTIFKNPWYTTLKTTVKNTPLEEVEIGGKKGLSSKLELPEKSSILCDIFMWHIEFGDVNDIILGEHLNDRTGKYTAIEIKSKGIKGYFSETTGILRFLTEGDSKEQYWV